jgi:ribosomal protein S18 acetylase RimI-like enzyme
MPVSVATENDIPALVALMDSAYRGEGAKQGWTNEADLFAGNKRTNEAEVEKLMKKPGAVFLKHQNDENILDGCVFLQNKKGRIYLGMFSVSPIAQGMGIGKKLLAAADDFAKQQGASSIYMTVITVRTELIAWYERNGYKKTGEIIPFPVDERFGIPTQPLELCILEKITG